MGNTKFSRLALLGLSCIASLAGATVHLSGGGRLDTYSPKLKLVDGDTQKDKDCIELTRARLNMHGDLATNWTYYIRFDATQGFRTPSNPHDYKVSQAYVTWHRAHDTSLSMGQGAVPFFSADEHYYKPYIVFDEDSENAGGILRSKTKDHLGLTAHYGFEAFSSSFGLWKETGIGSYELIVIDGDNEFSSSNYIEITDNVPIRLGWGGRMAFAPVQAHGAGFVLGGGIACTPVSYILSMIGSDGTNNQTYTTNFKHQYDYILDLAGVIDCFQINAAYSLQRLVASDYAGTLVSSDSSSTSVAVNNLFTSGKANAFYAEIGYLLKGDSYKISGKTGSVAGINHYVGESAFEVVLRGGVENRIDAVALFSDNQSTYDNTESQNLGTSTLTGTSVTLHHRKKQKNWSLHANYYFSPKVAMKTQYQLEYYQLDDFTGSFSKGNGSTPNLKKLQSFSARAEYSFDM